MRQLRAMMKKELFEQLKTHRLVVMLLLFTLVGVLSPAFAKMTPWLLDLVCPAIWQRPVSRSAIWR